MMRFNIDADLSPLFANWNTKQLYVSLVADWNSTAEVSRRIFRFSGRRRLLTDTCTPARHQVPWSCGTRSSRENG